MHKICLTGGPCGGKSTSLAIIRQKLEQRGYKVAIAPEAATKIITSGIVPGRDTSGEGFQRMVLKEQLHNENMFRAALEEIHFAKDTVLLCDRGIGDQYAYMDAVQMDAILNDEGLSREVAYSRYDAVIHLKTAADGAEEFYQWNNPESDDVGNNSARSESPEEAMALDKRTLEGWIGHPHLRLIDNSTDFTGKVDRAIDEVFAAIGEPVPLECEKKFLIKRPTIERIEGLGYVSSTHIVQTYLNSHGDNRERRVRRRGSLGTGHSYYYTEKTELNDGSRREVEHQISAAEYTYMLKDATYHVEKDRYCFMYKGRYFELDIFPFDTDKALLEVELHNMDEEVELPGSLIVERDVTYDLAYRNSRIAATHRL